MAFMEQQSVYSRLQQDLNWRSGLLADTRKTIEGIQAFLKDGAGQLSALEARSAPVQAEANELTARIKILTDERDGIAGAAGAGETRLAVLQETLRNLSARQTEVERDLDRQERRLSELAEQGEAAAREENDISRQRDEYASEVASLAARLAEIEERVAPTELEVRVLETEVSRMEAEQTVMQESVLEAETAHSRASVERQRCVGVLDSLKIEISEELGGGNAAEPAAVLVAGDEPSGSPDPAQALTKAVNGNAAIPEHGGQPGHLPQLTIAEMTDLERKVYALKSRISRMGPVNPLAQEEHTALVERHDYLQTQLWDLQGAADRLRRIITELDRTMREEFVATFAKVNEAFQHYFTTLFGGGTAHLELTNPQDVSASGVELMAQPPGKRMQPLAALSGGERALTSAAILFALLKVRPVPFCVLDEVDAALDESNVTRFRASLQELGDRTQFVVITHNRGTIEAADTLYGVSMAGDGTSHMLSLKVEA
jgi:chromosome segregation protein